MKRKRTSSNEDPRTPKKNKLDQRTESAYEEKTRIGRERTDEEIKRRDELKKLKAEQMEARREKLARQDEEDKKTQKIIDKQGKVAKDVEIKQNRPGLSTKIRPFRAVNEGNLEPEEDDKNLTLSKRGHQGTSNSEDDREDPGEPSQNESTRDDTKSEGSIEPEGIVELEFGSEIDQEDEVDYEYNEDEEDELEDEQEDPSMDPSPERKIILKTSTKNAGRLRRRKKQKQLARDQKEKPVRERIPQNMRPGHKGAQN